MRSLEPIPDDVIDRLFSALTVRYGSPFLDRWRDIDLTVVKGDWARELAGFGGNLGALRFGLDNLPEKPPGVIDFRKLCNAAPPLPLALPNNAPVSAPTPEECEILLRISDDIRRGEFFAKPGREWAYRLIHRHENGDPRPPMCVAMARRAIDVDQGRRRFDQ